MTLLNIDGKMMGFLEFVELQESVAPLHTEYGTDGKNGQWHTNGDWHHTFFSHGPDHHVLVAMNHKSGELSFGTHHGEFTTNHEPYDEKRTHLSDSLRVFNKVVHVAIHGAKHHNMKHIRFHAADPKLNHTYDMMIRSKHLQNHLQKHGFHYVGMKDGSHTFEHREGNNA